MVLCFRNIVFYFTWISYIVGSIPLNIDMDALLTGQKNSVLGRRLENLLIRTTFDLSFLQCVRKCLVRKRCLSINYNMKNMQCEMNKGDEKQNFENFKSDNNFIYSNMEFWNKTVLLPSPCDHHVCPEKYKCVPWTIECQISDCGEPPSIDNAITHGDGIAKGYIQYYYCLENYRLVGDNQIQCQKSGNWTTVQASCQFNGCGAPPEISHSTYNKSDKTGEYEAYEYICDVGYEVEGIQNPVVCQKNGTWSKILFKYCGNPRTIAHATSSGTGTSFGHSQTFTCNTGYTMSGDGVIRCMENGRWSNILFRCTTIDCLSLYDAGVRTNGTYEISPNNMDRFNVSCDMYGGGWVVINRRVNGQVDFDREWTDYVNGFGDLNADLWLGLKYIHMLASSPTNISFTFLMVVSGNEASIVYSNFEVSGENDKFRMYVSQHGVPNGEMTSYIGNLDGFYYHNGMQFSTKDFDNDLSDDKNCASYSSEYYSSGGYWYKNCLQLANINAKFSNMNIYNGMTPYGFSSCVVKIRRMV